MSTSLDRNVIHDRNILCHGRHKRMNYCQIISLDSTIIFNFENKKMKKKKAILSTFKGRDLIKLIFLILPENIVPPLWN